MGTHLNKATVFCQRGTLPCLSYPSALPHTHTISRAIMVVVGNGSRSSEGVIISTFYLV